MKKLILFIASAVIVATALSYWIIDFIVMSKSHNPLKWEPYDKAMLSMVWMLLNLLFIVLALTILYDNKPKK